MKYDLTYLSLGGGIQSSAMLAMSVLGAHGVPKVDCAIFADTKGEIDATYSWMVKLKAWSEGRGVRVIITTKGSLEEDALGLKSKHPESIPAFMKKPDGKRAILPRSCTLDYKIEAVRSEARRQMGLTKGQRAKGVKKSLCLMGISLDEVIRMKPSPVDWIENTFPLVDAKLTREDCAVYCKEVFGEVPPRSSCYYCPHHSDSYWVWLRDRHPLEWEKAAVFDGKLRTASHSLSGEVFLHSSLVPLKEVVLKPKASSLGEFGGECEGMCGN